MIYNQQVWVHLNLSHGPQIEIYLIRAIKSTVTIVYTS